jgi:DNA mismatch repair protein MutS2
MAELSSWVDDALLLGIEQAKVTHGKGTGILKETVRSILKKYKEVIIVNDPGDKETDYATTVKFSV